MFRRSLFALAALALLASCGLAQTKPAAKEKPASAKAKTVEEKSGGFKVDKNLPEYKAVTGVSGSIRSNGSDTMVTVMTKWCEGFKKYYPNVTFAVEGKGSGTAMPGLEE